MRHASVVEHGPLDRQRLSGRQPAIGLRLFLFSATSAIISKYRHSRTSARLEYDAPDWFQTCIFRIASRAIQGIYAILGVCIRAAAGLFSKEAFDGNACTLERFKSPL
jgi:hypothetical protein